MLAPVVQTEINLWDASMFRYFFEQLRYYRSPQKDPAPFSCSVIILVLLRFNCFLLPLRIIFIIAWTVRE